MSFYFLLKGMKITQLIFFFLFCNLCVAQTQYQGNVLSTNGELVEGVVISVSKSQTANTIEQLLVSDHKGAFLVELDTLYSYKFKTQHLSFNDSVFDFNPQKQNKIQLVLAPAKNSLKEIVITHERPKVKIKNDTTSFNILKFIDPSDRKLKDLVEKLPGLTIQDDGVLYFKGKVVSKLLVENQEFFGGSTKLGLDNIPADAIEKLEIIANYSKSKILKNSRRTNDQVINLILKEDKKNIVFGNAEAATDFNEFYKLHAALFQFKKKQQNNAILDVNNIAENGISISDTSTFLNVNSTLFNVVDVPVNYMINDTDFSEVKNQLATVNLKRTKTNSTWDFLSYYNKVSTTEEEKERLENLENFSVENRFMLKEKTSDALFFRLENDMFTSKKERLFSFHFSVKEPEMTESIISESDFGNKNINTSNDETIINSSVIFEETKRINKASNLVYGVNLDYKKDKNDLNLSSDLIFLEDQINWLNQDAYRVGHKENVEKAKAIAAAQYYYTINKHHVLLFSLSLGYDYENAVNNQAQILDDNSQNSFGDSFNSDAQLNTVKIVPQFSYSYFKNQWEANFGAKLNMVDWRFKNAITKNNNFITAFNPFLYLSLIHI